jgi:hypothetical protein
MEVACRVDNRPLAAAARPLQSANRQREFSIDRNKTERKPAQRVLILSSRQTDRGLAFARRSRRSRTGQIEAKAGSVAARETREFERPAPAQQVETGWVRAANQR